MREEDAADHDIQALYLDAFFDNLARLSTCLLVTARNGKTGLRVANTMSGAVSAYERLRKRYPDVGGEDYIFLPYYANRATAARIFARQFNVLLDETGLKHDPVTETERSVYCQRHTAI